MMDVLCLYHADCFDGIGAAWAVKQRYPDAECIAVEYRPGEGPGDELLAKMAGKSVVIVDFSYDPQYMDTIVESAGGFTFLDHHPRSKEIADALDRTYGEGSTWERPFYVGFSAIHSGVTMAWLHLFGDSPPPLLCHIEDRDLWRWELPDSKAVMEGLGSYPLELATWLELFDVERLRDGAFVRGLREKGELLLQKRESEIDLVIKLTARPIRFGGDDVTLINCSKSLTSEALARLAKEAPFAMSYYDGPEYRTFSLRSAKPGGRNVKELAVEFGGGGHDHAAGFRVPRDHDLAKI